jgi:signal transduction histidine kinase
VTFGPWRGRGKARTLPEAMIRAPSERSLVGAGFVAWMAAGVPQMAAWASGRACFEPRSLVWCAAYGSFAITFYLAACKVRRSAWRAAALAGQSVAALAALAIGMTGFEGALLCVVAGEAPLVVGENTAFVWVIAQTAAMVAVGLLSHYHSRAIHLSAFAYAGFQLFAFGASRLVVREAQARAELGRVHAELLATRELFADSTRTAERLRIARELHDALGHHLTALNLQLELARNIADGHTKEPVGHAHALTKELLVELRSVVSAMREEAPVDLSGALQTLASGIPHPRVHLDFENDLRVEVALAHTIFRCVQEALTNAVRHAGAENVFLSIETKDDTVAVTVRDDGRGAVELRVGHGLSGLRERIEGMGGKIEVEAQPGVGLTLRALLPARVGAP